MTNTKMKATFFNVLKSKFGISTIIFLLIIFFFDSYNIIRQIKLNKQISELQNQKMAYKDEIKKLSSRIQVVENDKMRVAREKYYYKEADELLLIYKDKKP